MLAYERKEFCTGCTACMNSCPHDAISMQADREGFLYPVTDEKVCTDCGLCRQICPLQDGYKISSNFEQPKVYATKHIDDDVRMSSSSGGMFTAISDYILSKKGIVYGAAFDENFRVCHQKAETVEERNKFRGSKYVQSDLNGIFKDIKNELKKGRIVLFTGTPCQNAGLHAYLNKDYENLYLCDLVCHGTPSPLIFEKYIGYLQDRYGSQIKELTFRFKPLGWRSQAIGIKFTNRKEYVASAEKDVFYRLFLPNIILRESCYHCRFTNFFRPSDITIADFWEIEKSMPDFDDNIGVSLVLVNSYKGMELFQNISDQINYRESNTIDCLQFNLHSPSKPSPKREQFWRDYWDKGFEYVLKRYAGYGLTGRTKRFVRKGLEISGLLPIVKKLLLLRPQ